jgi:hypothetical protein
MDLTSSHRGRVLEWHADDGWGLSECPGVDGPGWAHYGVIAMDGYRYRATCVIPLHDEPS